MQTIKDILEPVKNFDMINEAFNSNVDDYFKDLVKQSKVNVGANNVTCEEIYDTQAKVQKVTKKRTGDKVGKGFAIFFAVAGYIAMVAGIVILVLILLKQKNLANGQLVLPLCLMLGGLAIGLSMTLVICLVINKKIKEGTKIIDELNKVIEKKTDEAWKQMAPLNNMFGWNIPQMLITETVPLIQLDRAFEPYRFYQLINDYDFNPDHGNDESTICVQSGTLLGNPFLFEKTIYTWMGTYTYVGSIVITWTTYERDANGNSHAVTHTQTLTASVTKPKPYYDTTTNLIYGNGAAPDLMFERSPANKDASKMNEKQLNKYVKRQSKKLDKKSDEAVSKGGTYVKMNNDEFETLFNCTNRSNEQQFRLLFTPIGQKNMIELFKHSPFGDDFEFVKDHMINLIHSGHSQSFEYHAAPWLYKHFDYNEIERIFKDYNNGYLKSVFYDLAPLLSIPLYQQYKSHEYIYKSTGKSNLTFHEVESLCNYFGPKNFAHPETATDTILKCEFWDTNKAVDNVVIHAYSYKAIQHTTFIPRVGGDGHTHNVPVVWYEYVPLHKITKAQVMDQQGYMDAHKKGNIEKEFGIKPSYGQKGLVISAK